MSGAACKEHPTKQPSTSRLLHYQHFKLIWRDQQHAGKTTWALSIIVETYEPLSPPQRWKQRYYLHVCKLRPGARAHISHMQSRLFTRIMSNRAIRACKPQIRLIWEIRTEQQDNQQHPDTQLLFHSSTVPPHFLPLLLWPFGNKPRSKGI